jgi:hypothetical protein
VGGIAAQEAAADGVVLAKGVSWVVKSRGRSFRRRGMTGWLDHRASRPWRWCIDPSLVRDG